MWAVFADTMFASIPVVQAHGIALRHIVQGYTYSKEIDRVKSMAAGIFQVCAGTELSPATLFPAVLALGGAARRRQRAITV